MGTNRSMIVASTVEEVRAYLGNSVASGQSLGLVPTMGALHAGHGSLIERARAECDVVAVSVFVNPLQFGAGEDLDSYPRTRDADLAHCRERCVDLVFCPEAEQMYGGGVKTTVHVSDLTASLCGRSREGHFDGVCTVVNKLFNIVRPDRAYFGEKDYQQLVVVRRMVRDLSMPVEIVACPIMRDVDGLALSSRNAYLSSLERDHALAISRALFDAVATIRRGERYAQAVVDAVRSQMIAGGVDFVEYVSIVKAEDLGDVSEITGNVRICVAARCGETRLIDNVGVDVSAPA